MADNSRVPVNVKTILISSDRPFQGPTYEQEVAPDGTFTFPKVLPSKYWALLDIDADTDSSIKWSTIKTELLVNGNVDHASLILMRK
jgi:hypothetical protein